MMTAYSIPLWFLIVLALVFFSLGVSIGKMRTGSKRSPKASKPGRSRSKPEKARGTSNGGPVELYVGNLSYDLTEDQLRKTFEKFGKVASARLITHRLNKRSKGFGFVEMPVRSEAMAAIDALNDKDVQGRKMRVNEARGKNRPDD